MIDASFLNSTIEIPLWALFSIFAYKGGLKRVMSKFTKGNA